MTYRRTKVLALIPPRERYVGHWACSSERFEVHRLIVTGGAIEKRVAESIEAIQPDYLAFISKQALEYLDLVQDTARHLPKIFRCQNTTLNSRFGERTHDFNLCRNESTWFRIAADPRWDVILVQTLDDVDIIRRHLPDKKVIACPYGYDPQLFRADFPEIERDIDIGCYMKTKDHPARIELIQRATQIAKKYNLRFYQTESVYWHPYAELIQRTKIMLNWSIDCEVPFRMYETAISGAVFLTNPLKCAVDQLFTESFEYVAYRPDFSDLEEIITGLLNDPERLRSLAEAGKKRALNYSWDKIADNWIASAIS